MTQRNRRRPAVEGLEGRQLLSAGFTEYPIANGRGRLAQATTVDRRGNLWFTESVFSGDPSEIGRITPNGKMTLFPLPGGRRVDFGGITVGPDGNVWFTELANPAKVGRITPRGKITEFNLPDQHTQLGSITAGRDGSLWFTELNSVKIGRITSKGEITEFNLPDHGVPRDIVAGRGGNLWYGDTTGIGRVTPKGAITHFNLPSLALQPTLGLTAGPGGDIWFTTGPAYKGAAVIGRIKPNGAITQYNVPAADGQYLPDITADRRGNLWFTESGPAGSAIGRLAPSGAVTKYPTPNPDAAPFSIVAAPSGAIWFSEVGTNAIGKFLPNAARGPLRVTAAAIAANDATPFDGVVATFRGPAGNRAAGDYSAAIDWGDGSSSTGTVVADGRGGFQVLGTHPYERFGAYSVTVTVFDQAPRGHKPGLSASATGRAQVADAPLALSGATVQTVAGHITYEAFGLATGHVQQELLAGDLTISIDWGDGTTSPGRIIPPFAVYVGGVGQPSTSSGLVIGSGHIYEAAGTYGITITIHDVGGATTVVKSTAEVAPDIVPAMPVEPGIGSTPPVD